MATPNPAAAPQPFPQRVPLPPNPFDQVHDTPSHDAYQCCLQNETEAGNGMKLLVYARCLGYLLLEAPSSEARDIIAHEIIECAIQQSNIDLLADFYINHLFRLFRQNKGHTPIPSEHPSRPSFETHSAFFSVVADPAPKDHATAKKSALLRDGGRCMITGSVDYTVFSNMTDTERQEHFNIGGGIVHTNFCHIFPPSTNWNLNPQEHGHPKTKYSGNVWGIVNGFGSIDVLAELNGDNVHRLSNGLTLSTELHQCFDSLSLWFEEVPNNPHTYTVRTLFPGLGNLMFPYPLVVTFTTTTDLDLPDPKYLKLHAAVCRVAHMSGAAGYLDLYDREMEERRVMACDGSSADLLISRLSQTLCVG